MSDPYVIMNSGAGAVGKTSVVTEALVLGPEMNLRVASMPSPTRSVYAKLGISTEKDATEMSVEDQLRLQYAIHEAYYAAVTDFIHKHQNYDVVFIDRCPIDHVSYLIHNLSKHLTLKDVQEHLGDAISFMYKTAALTRKTHIQYFEFPSHWHTYETESSDGFRYDSGGKNFMWDALLHSMLIKAQHKLANLPYADRWKFEYTWPVSGMSAVDRARWLLQEAK